jgi:hypothetical protein
VKTTEAESRCAVASAAVGEREARLLLQEQRCSEREAAVDARTAALGVQESALLAREEVSVTASGDPSLR